MDIKAIATQLFLSQLGGKSDGMDQGIVMSALGGLLGGDDGELDLGDILSKFQGGGLASMAMSWLGDGDNEGISASQVMDILGNDKVSEFAGKVGIDAPTASDGLAGMIPKLIDQGSEGGGLLDMAGGADGLLGMAKKLF